jgi:hypothetical protein
VTGAAQGAGEQALAATGGSPVTLTQAALAGLRQPIVAILLLIALFTTVSGKPLDGFLMLIVAVLLVWDAARTKIAASGGLRGPRPTQVASLADGPGYVPEGPGYSAVTESASYRFAGSSGLSPQAPAAAADLGAEPLGTAGTAGTAGGSSRRRPRLIGAVLGAAGVVYAGVVGSFSRYSWPVTIAVVALGCLMVAIGWQGPLRQREPLTGTPLRRAWLWAVVLVTGGLWELNSLLQQPHLTTDSFAHPTISALTDPLLASHPGRSVALGAWLLIGWFVVGR